MRKNRNVANPNRFVIRRIIAIDSQWQLLCCQVDHTIIEKNASTEFDLGARKKGRSQELSFVISRRGVSGGDPGERGVYADPAAAIGITRLLGVNGDVLWQDRRALVKRDCEYAGVAGCLDLVFVNRCRKLDLSQEGAKASLCILDAFVLLLDA